MPVVKFLERFVRIAGYIVAWATVLPIAFFSLLQMLDRKLKLGVSAVLPDISTALLFIMIMMLFGFTYLRDGHVRVDVLRRNWSNRTLAIIEITGVVLILLPLCAILAIFGWDGLMRTTHFAETDVWAMRIAAVIGPVLLGIAGITTTLRNIAFLRGKNQTHAPLDKQGIDQNG
ncbi:MAG: TRAP transporter small permease subunit [Rhodobacterales bacterium]|nr:TRAP transporter small permease subunit [Rhodobacterales bacterium]